MFQYSKYIIAKILGPIVIICFSLTAIAWLTQSLRLIDMIVNRGLDIGTFFYLSSLILPSMLWVVIPISLFISVLFVYNRLITDSELIALKSAGISRFGLVKPALIFSIFICMVSYFVALYLLPASFREFKDTQSFIRDNYASLLLQEGVFTSPTKGLTVYIRERDSDGILRGMLLHDNRIPEKNITMMAEEGQLFQTSSGPRFLLINGNRQEIDKSGSELSLLYFDRYSLDLGILNTEVGKKRWREPQELYLNELLNPEDTPEFLIQKLKAEAHHRMTWPLYNIILTMLALTAFVTSEFNRQGQTRRVFIVVGSAIGLIIWALAINNIVANNGVFTPLIYVTLVLGLIVCIYFLLGSSELSYARKILKLRNTV